MQYSDEKYEKPSCVICGERREKKCFSKISPREEEFTLVQCRICGLEFVSPRPVKENMAVYYEDVYFTKRTDRGYDNYFSNEMKREISRVFGLNCSDLGLFDFEQDLKGRGSSLDIGCAAGYFVEYMEERGWKARGIDVSSPCIDYARSRNLDVVRGDYLSYGADSPFDLITLWATIEHLHEPEKFLEKIHCDLKDDGKLFISTCRTGGMNFKMFRGPDWRFYNFPEHLYFFSRNTMASLLDKAGFRVEKYFTYGSGFGKGGSVIRKAADFAAKKFNWGDMMLVSAVKKH